MALDRQQSLADQLAGLAEQQHAMIEAERTDDLLDLLARRQQVVNEFLTAQDQFAELTADLDQRIESLGGEQRQSVRQRIDQIGRQLASVLQSDEHDQQRLETARGQVVRAVEKIGATRQVNNAYRVPTGSATRFTDHKG